jgi:hypothetical protein
MVGNQISKTSEQARHEIATAAVGLFIALAFALMAEGVKESWKEAESHAPVIIDSIVFTLGALSFFLGTQAWLWSDAIQTATSRIWLYNFFFTLVTLIVITMMGAFVGDQRMFYAWVFALYAVQCIWILAGSLRAFRLNLASNRTEFVLQSWWARFAAIGMCILLVTAVTPFPIHYALPALALLRCFNLGFDLFYAVPTIWGQTD